MSIGVRLWAEVVAADLARRSDGRDALATRIGLLALQGDRRGLRALLASTGRGVGASSISVLILNAWLSLPSSLPQLSRLSPAPFA